jgi:anti-anti-sigma factor
MNVATEHREAGFASLSIRPGRRRWQIAVAGEVDLSNAEQLDREIKRAIEGARGVELDLRGVRFLDSIGIKTLVRAGQWADGHCELKVLPPSADVMGVIEMSGVADLIPFER